MESCMMGNYHVQFGGQFLLILLYLLSSIYRNSELSTTGGLIYFLLGGLSSCFILLGTSLLYINSGTTSMDGLYILNSIGDVNEGTIGLTS